MGFLKRLTVFLAALAVVAGLGGCATASPEARRQSALALAAPSGWQAGALAAGDFRLLALHPAPQQTPELAVFIEGDGLAWLDPRTPSADPTPVDPVALRLALAERHRPSVYLARPCQFDAPLTPGNCRAAHWTQARFSPEIIAAMDQGLSQLKAMFGAQRLVLVGYSGGGTVAALLAARRKDVSLLITVAAVLDHQAWTRAQGISPLRGSLNPADEWSALRGLRQIHFVGAQDKLAGRMAVQPFLDRFAPAERPRLVEVPAFTHACCWAEAWKRLSPP
ncbi:alpha/beta fold hydrolase [Polaromonas sp. YR568]|uniref:alpha/beta fold hydrolase n=1 Tax=Polaromonas sp. YR568 TaxID=1855301 RepID=UPI00398BFEAE